MDYIDELEDRTIYLLRETYFTFKKPAILWSMGKDSTSLVYMCKKAFLGNVPFPVIHIDTGYKFPEMYSFRTLWSKEWNLNLVISSNEKWLERISPEKGKFECCNKLKTEALKRTLKNEGYDALILAIRRDEHGIRAKERYFSPRSKDFTWDYKNQPLEVWDQFQNITEEKTHIRVHPILHWREIDIWRYTEREHLPVNEMYFSKEGKRYRSLGCSTCTIPIDSSAGTIRDIVEELEVTKEAERAGRAQDKEKAFTMQKLRMLGYM